MDIQKGSQLSRFGRRVFLQGLSATPIALLGIRVNGASLSKLPICVFSKHLQWLDFEQMGETAASIGFDGIDLTVRPGGHISPEDAVKLLPVAVKAVEKAGLKVPMITTSITSATDSLTEPLLRTAADLGVKYYRMGYYRYSDSESVEETVQRVHHELAALAEVNQKFGICGDYQNHAGANYFGAPIWDLWAACKGIDPKSIGSQFDLRHATVEGAHTWPTNFRLIRSRLHTIVVKDFRWKTEDSRKATIEDCPLGMGITPFEALFPLLVKTGFSGPITTHFEYPLGGADRGARELELPASRVVSQMRTDLKVLRDWLSQES